MFRNLVIEFVLGKSRGLYMDARTHEAIIFQLGSFNRFCWLKICGIDSNWRSRGLCSLAFLGCSTLKHVEEINFLKMKIVRLLSSTLEFLRYY